MQDLFLWDNIESINLDELGCTQRSNSELLNILQSTTSKTPKLSYLLSIDIKQVKQINTLYKHIFMLTTFNSEDSSAYLSNLSDTEKEVLEIFKDILSSKTFLLESDVLKSSINIASQHNIISNILI